MTDRKYQMPSLKELNTAADTVHVAIMAMYGDEPHPAKARLLPIPGNPNVTAFHLLQGALATGREAIWLLSRAVEAEALELRLKSPSQHTDLPVEDNQ